MHVRIAWEIYNHQQKQQKAKSDAKVGGVNNSALLTSSHKLGQQHSFDLLNKTPGLAPGAEFNGKRPGPPQELLRSSAPSVYPPSAPASIPGFPPRPPNPFDPLARDPYGAQRYGAYGTSSLAAAAASYHAGYPTPASASAAPFGGLGGILPSPATPARPPVTTPSSLSSYPSYGHPHHPAVNREKEEAEKRAREERERRHREEAQRDSEQRANREAGYPAYVKERDRNGEAEQHRKPTNQSGASDLTTNHRERSPLRQPDRRVSTDSGAVDLTRPADLSNKPTDLSRPSSVASSVTGHVKPASEKPREERICDDISIIEVKEGNRSGANSVGVVGGRASVSSDHSLRNGQDHPQLSNGVKSYYPGHTPTPPRPPPPVSSYLPPTLAPPAPSHDPRTLAMFPHMMGQSIRPHNPLDPYGSAYAAAAALDPYRAAAAADPFRMDLLARDPLRAAREQELLRLGAAAANTNPLHAELERAKALSQLGPTAGYPGLPSAAGYPGYPPTTLAAAAHLTNSHFYPPTATQGLHHLAAGYPHPTSLGYPAAPGLNGAGLPGQYAKDPLRR